MSNLKLILMLGWVLKKIMFGRYMSPLPISEPSPKTRSQEMLECNEMSSGGRAMGFVGKLVTNLSPEYEYDIIQAGAQLCQA